MSPKNHTEGGSDEPHAFDVNAAKSGDLKIHGEPKKRARPKPDSDEYYAYFFPNQKPDIQIFTPKTIELLKELCKENPQLPKLMARMGFKVVRIE